MPATTGPSPSRPTASTRVAVVGAGTMGSAVASRLLSSRLDVAAWSRRPATTRPLRELGATTPADVADAVSGADVVVTLLPTADAVAGLMFGGGGIDAMRPDAVWVQMATIGAAATMDLDARARARRPDVVFVDAPVSGSREPAETGRLLILASGPEAVAGRLEPVFGALGRRTMWLGPVGAGSKMKLVLNTLLAFETEAAAEVAALAGRLDVDQGALVEALGDNPLASGYAMAKLTRMIQGDETADFALEWALKDLDLVASDAGVDVAPVAAAIADRWRQLVRDGSGGLDVAAARRGLGHPSSGEPGLRGP
jgi:3-hydroxyisobutyrate dehydrogenase